MFSMGSGGGFPTLHWEVFGCMGSMMRTLSSGIYPGLKWFIVLPIADISREQVVTNLIEIEQVLSRWACKRGKGVTHSTKITEELDRWALEKGKGVAEVVGSGRRDDMIGEGDDSGSLEERNWVGSEGS
ncbi:hypothetical protein Salat_2514600 [Sesamum alatum]|uniref:Uncharacterized protein n=1 Tax=Sesamum alatum TaxID=300844 RepID=A0AAE1XS03_9LAMI|nr:hypothetical protein Salat_2514600 [Sesamum alatum]